MNIRIVKIIKVTILIGIIVLSVFKIICKTKNNLAKRNTNIVELSSRKEIIINDEKGEPEDKKMEVEKTEIEDYIVEGQANERELDNNNSIQNRVFINNTLKKKNISYINNQKEQNTSKPKVENGEDREVNKYFENTMEVREEDTVHKKGENITNSNEENTTNLKEENKKSSIDLSKAESILPEWLKREVEDNINEKRRQ